jgi:integral membrane protein (TIGR01906 family)
MKNKIAAIVFAIALFFLILTLSIGLPIYIRPFFYAHIAPLDLEAESGFTRDEIIEAYNDVLDYLTLPGKPFCSGVMRYSEDGAAHFADCKGLFNLNAAVLIGSALTVTVILILYRKKVITSLRLGGVFAGFYGAVAAIAVPSVLGYYAYRNFLDLFTEFHKLLFPDKYNWYFDPETDEIINVLPPQFFMNCAILIGIGIVTLSASVILFSLIRLAKEKRKHAQ